MGIKFGKIMNYMREESNTQIQLKVMLIKTKNIKMLILQFYA